MLKDNERNRDLHKIRLQKLIEIARLNKNKQERRSFHVAAVYQRGVCISLAFNQRKSHPRMKGLYPDFPGIGLHAEFAAILGAKGLKGNYRNCTLYVARLDNNGFVASSAPCEHCSRVLAKVGLKFYNS